jgi:hypothetical protein
MRKEGGRERVHELIPMSAVYNLLQCILYYSTVYTTAPAHIPQLLIAHAHVPLIRLLTLGTGELRTGLC